ncbi:MAG: hypothetical protein P4L84_12015 [Isosphaeraceae bacterium]|nr:hypothetical protein [Isosphaeraceae bacterium]
MSRINKRGLGKISSFSFGIIEKRLEPTKASVKINAVYGFFPLENAAMNCCTKLLFAFALVLSMGESSVADSITYIAAISETLPYTFTGTTASTTAAVLPQFSASLGTLNSVTIQQQNVATVDAISQVEAGEFVNGSNISVWNWNTNAIFALGVPGRNDPGTIVSFSTYGEYDSPQLPVMAHVNFSTTIAGNSIAVNANNFSSYIGNGDTSVTLYTGISTQVPPLSATLAGFTWQLLSKTLAAGIAMEDTDTISVTYHYSPSVAVPEPSSFAMLFPAFCCIVFYRRFVQRKTICGS